MTHHRESLDDHVVWSVIRSSGNGKLVSRQAKHVFDSLRERHARVIGRR